MQRGVFSLGPVLGLVMLCLPLAADAQQTGKVWHIGYISVTDTPGEPQAQSRRLVLEAALARLGYVQGKNLVIERRLLGDHIERVNGAAAELAALPAPLTSVLLMLP